MTRDPIEAIESWSYHERPNMSSKVIKYRGAWWIRTHVHGAKSERRFGPTNEDKSAAKQVAKRINAKIALGEYDPSKPKHNPIPFDEHLRTWHKLYSPTFKPRYRLSAQSLLDNHLIPYFGKMDLREIRREDLIRYINHKMTVKSKRTERPLATSTIQNGLTIIRRVLRLAVQDELIDRDPSAGIGAHLAKLARNQGIEAEQRESFTRGEAEKLLALASNRLPEFEPFLRLLLSTGMRVGEAIGLEWRDVNFDRGVIDVRRSVSGGFETAPKSGKSRIVYMSPSLSDRLHRLLTERRADVAARKRRALKSGKSCEPAWVEVPSPIFCSQAGGRMDSSNLRRSWLRLHDFASAEKVRRLVMHCCRHTYATLALESGANIVFVSKQLGHHSPAFTLQVYGHALPSESPDMGFADFSTPDAPGTACVDVQAQRPERRAIRGSERRQTSLSVTEPEIQRLSAASERA